MQQLLGGGGNLTGTKYEFPYSARLGLFSMNLGAPNTGNNEPWYYDIAANGGASSSRTFRPVI